MKTTEQKIEQPTSPLTVAFVAAQLELENPKFDCVNPHFRSKYASLAASRKAVIPTFAKHGISITQNVTTTELGATCVTTYRHVCGETLEFGPLFVPCSKPDAWGMGSCISYVLRYSLNSSAGISGELDDDGEAAVNRSAEPASPVFKKKDIGVGVDSSRLFAELAEKMTDVGMINGHIRAFLESKNSWPKTAKQVSELPANILARLMVPAVWDEVVAFAPKPVEAV